MNNDLDMESSDIAKLDHNVEAEGTTEEEGELLNKIT